MRYGTQAAAPPTKPTLDDVITNLGIGAGQIKEAFVAGGVWLADGAELILIGSVTRAISDEWQLAPWQRGSVVSIVFIGVFFGNLASGPFSDSFGRKWPILISYATIACFSVLSAFTVGFWSLSGVRFLVGVSFGFGQPAWTALGSEITPSYWRVAVQTLSQSLFAFGEIYSAFLIWLDDPYMKNLDWRWLLMMGAIPSAIFLLLGFFLLRESAYWLALHGRQEDAHHALETMRWWNRKGDTSVDFQPPNASEVGTVSWGRQIKVIFGSSFIYSTMVTAYSCMVLNFLFYGGLYAIPQVLQEVDMGVSPAIAIMFGALWELPGFALAAAIGMFMNRRPAMLTGIILTSIMIALFTIGGQWQHHGRHYYYMLHTGYAGLKLSVCINFVVIYQYATEIYPTTARVAGTAICISSGRLGAISAPLGFELITSWTGTWTTFFWIMLGISLLNALLIVFLPYETRNKALKDTEHDEHETEPLVSCGARGRAHQP